jgi:hypothetical protein
VLRYIGAELVHLSLGQYNPSLFRKEEKNSGKRKIGTL